MAGPHPTIIVFRALPGLGDLLCAVPTLRAIRSAIPSARIHLVGLPSTRDLAGSFSAYVDEFHPFPGYPGLPEQPVRAAASVAFLRRMGALKADLAIQLHGSGDRTNDIVELFGARQVAGFRRDGERCPDPARFLTWDDDEPEVRRGLRLLRHLGLEAADERLELPLDPVRRATAATLLGSIAGRPYVVVHPGAQRPEARWDAAGFIDVAARLRALGREVVLTGGPAERTLTASVAAAVPGALDLAGRTGLDDLGWVVAGADLVVSNDTGVAHVAAALGTPSVVVLTPATAAVRSRWAPLDADRHRPVSGSVERVVRTAAGLLDSVSSAA